MLLQRWLSNSLGLLTAEELKDLYGLLKSRGLRWLTAGAQSGDLPAVPKQDGGKVSKCAIPLSYSGCRSPSLREARIFLFRKNQQYSYSMTQVSPKMGNIEGEVVRSSKSAKQWGVK